ncbi:hypothetical protein NC796_04410 [Aliifodinibius sp. S!AR15-10]|nr:hypothetical protein [Aliifodinibius sp. S!AR15-10]MDR8390372.1 hypothetical protein [Aliifodinibius sp. S!AR15-10]
MGNVLVTPKYHKVPLGAVTDSRRYGDRPLAVEGFREIELPIQNHTQF